MKFKLFGPTAEITHLTGPAKVEHDQDSALSARLLADIPRLQRSGRVQFGFGEMGREGWTEAEISSVVDSWPDTTYLPLTMIVSLAGAIRRGAIGDIDEVIAWTHALLESRSGGKIAPRQLVRTELAAAGLGRDPVDAITLWTEAAGSQRQGLAALRQGLTIAETRAQHHRPEGADSTTSG